MAGLPVFFGPTQRRRFGMWHEPTAGARAVMVLCPPLGYEGVCAHSALRDLGAALAERGVAALRVDYDGTGNSLGSDTDPDRVPAWLRSVHDAIDHARSRGFDEVTLMGVRIGGTLAASVAAERTDVSRLVLWDPVASGRRYVRSLKLMAAAGEAGTAVEGGLSTAGLSFADETLAAISRLKLQPGHWPARTLLVEASDGPQDARPSGELPDGTDVRALPGTGALLDTDVELAAVPQEIITTIADWEARESASHEAVHLRALRPEDASTEAEEVVDGVPLVHEAVRIGDDGLFATLTRPAAGIPRQGLVMLNNGSAPQLGPGRAWVAWAARLAADDLAVARLDLSGLGDSAPRPGAASHDAYPVAAGRDAGSGVAYLRERGVEHVALLGLCSGATLSFDGLLAAPEVEAVVSINARFDRPWTDRMRDRGVRAAGHTNRLLAIPLSKTPLLPLFERVPGLVWWLLDKLHLVASPVRALEVVQRRRARVLMVFGPREWGLRALRRRSGPDFERLLGTGRYEVVEIEGLDHSMFSLAARDRAFVAVRDFLRRTLHASSSED